MNADAGSRPHRTVFPDNFGMSAQWTDKAVACMILLDPLASLRGDLQPAESHETAAESISSNETDSSAIKLQPRIAILGHLL
jgi:hypothetical protein